MEQTLQFCLSKIKTYNYLFNFAFTPDYVFSQLFSATLDPRNQRLCIRSCMGFVPSTG